jgi:hypothetical protein
MLERCGGRNAFLNIKYVIPTYESCVNNWKSLAMQCIKENWKEIQLFSLRFVMFPFCKLRRQQLKSIFIAVCNLIKLKKITNTKTTMNELSTKCVLIRKLSFSLFPFPLSVLQQQAIWKRSFESENCNWARSSMAIMFQALEHLNLCNFLNQLFNWVLKRISLFVFRESFLASVELGEEGRRKKER